MVLRYATGNILDDPADLVVIPVNTVPGVLGAGLAKQAADRWPGLRKAHRVLCQTGNLEVGCPVVVPREYISGDGDPEVRVPRICLFPSKRHWRNPSRIEWVEDGLRWFAEWLVDDLDSIGRDIALPPLGCGLGGLAWSDVRPLIETWAATLPDGIDVTVYEPKEKL